MWQSARLSEDEPGGNQAEGEDQTADSFQEAIDGIRTVLLRDAATQGTRIVMVTSAVDGDGKTTLADALHTQIETAQQILFEGGGDYALTVKKNQKELVQTLATLLTRSDFSPSTHDADARADPGTQSEPT